MNIENVVKGLECCTERDKCDKKCPYWNSDKSCWINLKKDALALLKAQNKDAEIIRKCREGKVLKHVEDGVVVLNYDWASRIC